MFALFVNWAIGEITSHVRIIISCIKKLAVSVKKNRHKDKNN
jgi:hypothetical protein